MQLTRYEQFSWQSRLSVLSDVKMCEHDTRELLFEGKRLSEI